MRSASETGTSALTALNSCLTPCRVGSTFAKSLGLFTSQSFCGDNWRRDPLAPPRLSVPRNVDAEAQAVATHWVTDKPDFKTLPFNSWISLSPINRCALAGTGSCQTCGSGVYLPRSREWGPMSRCVNLYHALAKASLNCAGFS